MHLPASTICEYIVRCGWYMCGQHWSVVLSVSAIRLRFVPDSSYIQTVKGQRTYCRVGQWEQHVRVYPIIPVRFLFLYNIPCSSLTLTLCSFCFSFSISLRWKKKSFLSPLLRHFCSTFQHTDIEIFTMITYTFLQGLWDENGFLLLTSCYSQSGVSWEFWLLR